MDLGIKGKSALVCAASKGLGKGCALSLAREGVFGMHPTLLPRHRGRAPIPWAILCGLARTGVTLFEIVDSTADSGAIVGQVSVDIAADAVAESAASIDYLKEKKK